MPYPDFPMPVELVGNVPLLTLFLRGEPSAPFDLVPVPLMRHPDARVVLNLWVADDAALTTGFGGAARPIGIGYLAAEVEGPPGRTVDGTQEYPARFWLRHWCNDVRVRDYAYRVSGMTIDPAEITLSRENGRFCFAVHGADGSRIKASAQVATKPTGRSASRSVYYAQRKAGGGQQIARYDIPALADAFDASDASVECAIAGQSAGVPDGMQTVLAASFRRMTLVPYISSGAIG